MFSISLTIKIKKSLLLFNVIADTLGSIFITERIGGGIGILEIEQNQSELNVDLQLRRLLIASERLSACLAGILKFVFTMKSLKPLLTVKKIVEALAIAANDDTTDELFYSIAHYEFKNRLNFRL